MNKADIITPEEREFQRVAEAQRNPIEIRMADVPFEKKVNALCAALEAVRLAHQDEISAKSWALMNQAERLLADAIFCRNDRRAIDASKADAPFLQ